jgi:hypothetical protein
MRCWSVPVAAPAWHATCHELRHTCLTRLREAGMALEAVQAQAGHASIESTRIYLHLADDWLASQYNKAAESLAGETARAEQGPTDHRHHRAPTRHTADVLRPHRRMGLGPSTRTGADVRWRPAPAKTIRCRRHWTTPGPPKLLRAAQADKRLLVRVTVEVLLRRCDRTEDGQAPRRARD